jgi:hypothetical protein
LTVGAAVTVTVMATAAFRLPEVPLTVNCVALSAVELAAVRVSVLLAVVLGGLNDAVTPVGKPDAVKTTVPPKPPTGLTVIAAVPTPPAATLTLEGEDPRLNPGAGVTVKLRGVVAETLPDFAVIVAVSVVIVAETLAVSVSLLVELVLAGLNAAVTPGGNPEIVRAAEPVKPFTGATVMVLLPDAPCDTLRLAGAAASVIPGAPFTVRLNVTEMDDVPATPVMVTVVVPGAAAVDAITVRMLVVAVVAGLNEAAT